MSRQNATANASGSEPRAVPRHGASRHASPALRALHAAAAKPSEAGKARTEASSQGDEDSSERNLVRQAAEDQADKALPFFGPTPIPERGTYDGQIITRRMREKQLGREAVSAAALIMLLISFSVGLQLIMVEFVMTGTCAIPRNIAGVVLAMILTITMGLRSLVRFITAPLRPPGRFLWQCCCAWRDRNKAAKTPPMTQALPEPIMEQVVSFLSLEALCELGCASGSCKELVNSDCCYETLMGQVANFGLDHRWTRHLQRLKMVTSEGDSSGHETSEETVPKPEELPKTEKDGGDASAQAGDAKSQQLAGGPQIPPQQIRELRIFLCRQAQRNKAKAEEREVNERWNVLTDVVRYCMLVIGWFWFSAEVMDMACLEGGGPWQIVKAVSSPCLFIFILESDRNHFWWQVVAGTVAAVLLLDLLFA